MATKVSLGFAKLSDMELDNFAQSIIDSITGNATYPAPPVTVANLQTATAETDSARQARTRILRGARDEEKTEGWIEARNIMPDEVLQKAHKLADEDKNFAISDEAAGVVEGAVKQERQAEGKDHAARFGQQLGQHVERELLRIGAVKGVFAAIAGDT